MLRKKFVSAFAAVLLTVAPLCAFASHIDFFEDGAFNLSTSTGIGQVQNGLPIGTVLGGERWTGLHKNSGDIPALISASLVQGTGGTTDDNDVTVQMSSNGGVGGGVGSYLQFQYGMGNDLNANFLDIPNTMNDWDRIRVTFGTLTSPIDFVEIMLISREYGVRGLACPGW